MKRKTAGKRQAADQRARRALHPRRAQDPVERRLGWAQVAASIIDAIARLADAIAGHIR